MDLLENLNPQQKQAVLHTEGPLLILAGAGSGKTTVMTRRIAYLVKEKNVYPSSILAVTFTNNAANEMRERVKKLVGDETSSMWIGTFHSISLKILRRYSKLIGYDPNFVIYDEDDKKKLLTQLAEKAMIDPRYMTVSSLKSKISDLKNRMVSPDEYAKLAETDFRDKKIATVYSEYTKTLKANNALDFDDIIIKALELLANFPDVLDYYRRKFRYVMVDEYQDTNEPQFQFVKLLSSFYRNVCVVGDDDQSIYGWRGADITNILNFEKVFENATVIKLEQNYRSTSNIIKTANAVIKHNVKRKDKTLFTELGTGEPVFLCNTYDETAEAEFVCRQIKQFIDNGQYSYNDFAIMYRTNAQSRTFEDVFVKYGIKYNMVGSLRFYERKEIKDVISYLRFIVNDKDEQSLQRIINVPPRGIGDKTVQKLNELSVQNDQSLFATLIDVKDYDAFPEKTADRLCEFANLFLDLSALDGVMTPVEIIEQVLEKTGYTEWLKASNDAQKDDRIQNVEEFVAAAAQYTSDNGEAATLGGFLENMALVSDSDDLGKSGVSLMTIHTAKGTEYPVVFLTGMEEGLFPIESDNEDKLEEERRLFYVGITRAKKMLYISWANSRWKFKDRVYNIKSQFISELPKEYYRFMGQTEKPRERLSYHFDDDGDHSPNSFITGRREHNAVQFGKPVSSAIFRSGSPKDESAGKTRFSEGMRVNHSRYGNGTVETITKRGGVTILSVNFDNVGIKQFDASLAVLKIL